MNAPKNVSARYAKKTPPASGRLARLVPGIFSAPALFLFAASANAGLVGPGDDVVLKSPDTKIEAHIGVTAGGRLAYVVKADGRDVLGVSPLGITVDGTDLGRNPRLTGGDVVSKVDETYPVSGHHAVATNRANELLVPLETAGKKSALIVRVYDDGVAVRYALPEGASEIGGEATAWRLPKDATRLLYSEFVGDYQGTSRFLPPAKIPEGKTLLGPVMVELATPGGKPRYLSFTEADCVTFSDMGFSRDGDTLHAIFPYLKDPKGGWKIDRNDPEFRKGMPDGTYRGFVVSPWRTTLVARDLTALVTSDLLTNLCPAPDPADDFSWVRPGRAAWQWWSVGKPKYPDQKAWYDAAAKLGFEYYLIDDGWRGWSEPGKNRWDLLKEAIAYGKSVGVETIVWVNTVPENNTREKRRAYLEKIKAVGAAGIKIDHIPGATADRMAWYVGGMRDCADLHLLLDYHGCVKPTGLVRTFPNDITREGVIGNEWRPSVKHPEWTATQQTLTPFCRLLAGAADVTPVMVDPKALRGFTWPNQFAQAVVILSPLVCYCDHYEHYLANPSVDLLKALPTVWDETRVLDCSEPGEVVAYARRKGDTWWIGVMSAVDREVKIPLSFLRRDAAGSLLYDVPGKGDAADRVERTVRKGETLTVKLRPCGGFFARLVEKP